MKRVLLFVPLLMWCSALAQVVDPALLDPRLAGASPFGLGAIVLLIMASVKRANERRRDRAGQLAPLIRSAWIWYVLALVLGVAGAFLLFALKYGAVLALFGLGVPWSVVCFGLASGIVGAGYRDLLKSALGWVGQGGPVGIQSAPEPPIASELLPPDGVIGTPPDGARSSQTAAPLGVLGMTGNRLDDLVGWALQQAGLTAPGPAAYLRVGAKLAMVAPDLLDGDPHLSAENRDRVLAVVMDLKRLGGLQ
jgi:hypothetical protein